MEDRHIQLDQDKSLYHIDLILRTNDRGKYVAFDLFDTKKQEIIFTKKLKDNLWVIYVYGVGKILRWAQAYL